MKFDSHRSLTTLLLAGLALASPLLAQRADVSLKLDVVAWGDEIRGLSLKPGDAGGITALPFRYSEPVTYSGPPIMEIFRTGDGDAKNLPAPTADDKKHQLHPLPVEPANAISPDGQPKSALALELDKRRAKQPSLVALAPIPAGLHPRHRAARPGRQWHLPSLRDRRRPHQAAPRRGAGPQPQHL